MKTLEEVQAQFESKNRAGHEVNILAYHPDQEHPIIAELNRTGRWEAASFTCDGEWLENGRSEADLIKKRPALPKDILCEVWNNEPLGGKCELYSNGDGSFYNHGATSLTCREGFCGWDNYRVIENPPQPWFGGECPVPERCEFRVRIEGRWVDGEVHQVLYYWDRTDHITAYQILGEKESK
ncbi:MAG: hypothetical protein KUG81_09890 [Gammaproteobacteria bacterium]|nr:hypothetical protein [Gammaproteobacteria bacterium]